MIPQPFSTLWGNPTFAKLLRTLPTALTSSIFMLFALLELALACLKWTFFLLIIVSTFLFGLALLMISVLVLVGVLVGSVKEEGGAELRENAKQDVDAERKVEQERAVLEPDNEGRSTRFQRIRAVRRSPEDLRMKEVENYLDELFLAKSSPEINESDKENDIPRQGVTANMRRRASSPEVWEMNWPFGENA